MDTDLNERFEEQLSTLKNDDYRDYHRLLKDKSEEFIRLVDSDVWKESSKKGDYKVFTFFDDETGLK